VTAAVELLQHWIAHLRDERRFADNSLDAYQRDVAAFLGFLTHHLGGEPSARDLAELEPRDLRAYLAHRRQGDDALGSLDFTRFSGNPQLLSLSRTPPRHHQCAPCAGAWSASETLAATPCQ
jgi:site-specific recombinase XerD